MRAGRRNYSSRGSSLSHWPCCRTRCTRLPEVAGPMSCAQHECWSHAQREVAKGLRVRTRPQTPPPLVEKAVEKGGRNTEIKLMIPCANGRSIERVDATSTTGMAARARGFALHARPARACEQSRRHAHASKQGARERTRVRDPVRARRDR